MPPSWSYSFNYQQGGRHMQKNSEQKIKLSSNYSECMDCGGSGKCHWCRGNGKNNDGTWCRVCNGAGKCLKCGGTGKKWSSFNRRNMQVVVTMVVLFVQFAVIFAFRYLQVTWFILQGLQGLSQKPMRYLWFSFIKKLTITIFLASIYVLIIEKHRYF